MIIADENIDQYILDGLAKHGYNIYSIREHHPGISDRKVIQVAKRKKGVLITEDKDFGELVYSHSIKGCTVMLVRYNYHERDQIILNLIKALRKNDLVADNTFYSISAEKIRFRKI